MLVSILISDNLHLWQPDCAIPKPWLADHDSQVLDSSAISTPIPRQYGLRMTHSYTQLSRVGVKGCHGPERNDIEERAICR